MKAVLAAQKSPNVVSRILGTTSGIDGRIVEVARDLDRRAWRILRLRDDKPQPNHTSVVRDIQAAVKGPLSLDDVSVRQTRTKGSNC